jgi:hypothetical protein
LGELASPALPNAGDIPTSAFWESTSPGVAIAATPSVRSGPDAWNHAKARARPVRITDDEAPTLPRPCLCTLLGREPASAVMVPFQRESQPGAGAHFRSLGAVGRLLSQREHFALPWSARSLSRLATAWRSLQKSATPWWRVLRTFRSKRDFGPDRAVRGFRIRCDR